MHQEQTSCTDWYSNKIVCIDKDIVRYDIMEEHPMVFAEPEGIRSQVQEQ